MHSYYLYPYRQHETKVRLPDDVRSIPLEVNNDNVIERLREQAVFMGRDEDHDARLSRLLGTPNHDKTYDLSIRIGGIRYRYVISTMDDLRLRNGNEATILFEVSTRNDDEPIVQNEHYRYADVFMRELKEFYDDNTVIDSESEDEESDDEFRGKSRRKRRNKKVKRSKAKRKARHSKAKRSIKLKRKLKSTR